jgi:nucleotidyltransferase/DNA polymerase involved in DNA repair
MGKFLHRASQGCDTSPVLPHRECKSVSNETTFSHDEVDPQKLRKTLLHLSEKVAYRLRKKGMRSKTIMLKVRTADYYTQCRHTTLSSSTDSDAEIFQSVLELFEKVDLRAQSVRLLGVGGTQLEVENQSSQIELFASPDGRESRLTQAVDGIRQRFGEEVIGRATTSDEKKH